MNFLRLVPAQIVKTKYNRSMQKSKLFLKNEILYLEVADGRLYLFIFDVLANTKFLV
jgi:hypothetical protein